MTREQRQRIKAAKAAQDGAAGVLDLLSVTRFGDGKPGSRDAHAATANLLRAAKSAMEIAGFNPDEVQRGQLYRAIVEYTGEDS